MTDGAAILHAPVVTQAQDGSVVGDKRATDRHAALIAAEAGLLDGVIQPNLIAFRSLPS